MGALRTYKRISANVYLPRIARDVQRFVAKCGICQQNKVESTSPAGLLQPLPIPEAVWEDISMDFIEALPKSNSHEVIFAVVDRLTKFAHFIALKRPFTAKLVAKGFCREVVRLHGIPRSIVCDRDKVFTSLFWRELFRLQHTAFTYEFSIPPSNGWADRSP